MTTKTTCSPRCSLGAFAAAEKDAHVARSQRLFKALEPGLTWRASGFTAEADASRELLADVAQWIFDEARCCSFLTFDLQLAQGGKKISLVVTEAPGTEGFLRTELRGLGVSMHRLFTAGLAAVALFATSSAFALGVGAKAPCVGLEDRQPDGSVVEQCLRTRAKDHGFTLIEFVTTTDPLAGRNREALTKLGEEIGKRTTIRIVATDKDEKAVAAYLKADPEAGKFAVAKDPGGHAKGAFRVGDAPTVFLLDKSERVLLRHEGALTSEVAARIAGLTGG